MVSFRTPACLILAWAAIILTFRHVCIIAPLVPLLAAAQAPDKAPDADNSESPILNLELDDQFGNTNSLLRQRGKAVVVVVVSVRRLSMIERWERDLTQRVPDIRFLNVADLPGDVPVDAERTAATLRKRVPAGIAVLMDTDRRWATTYALDTKLPNLLVFDAEGRLLARFHGRWTAELAAQVARTVPRDPARGEPGA